MKKTFFYTVYAVIAAICASALRFAQYVFIIDKEGRYVTTSLPEVILKYSVGAVLIISVIFAFIALFALGKARAGEGSLTGGVYAGSISLVIALAISLESGLRVGNMLKTRIVDWIGIAGVLAVVYFAMLSIELFSARKIKISALFGIFPPVYVYLRGIILFFESFKTVNKSEMRIEMLTICALALFITAFVSVRVKANVRTSRACAVTSISFIMSTLFSLSGIYTFVTGTGSVERLLWLVQVFLFGALSLIALIRLANNVDSFEQKEQTEENTIPEQLDVYIDDIPEEEEETEATEQTEENE